VAKQPAWFPFFPNDWLSSTDILMMTGVQAHGYLLLLCHAWNSDDCGLPNDDQILSKLARIGREYGSYWPPNKQAILKHFVLRDNRWYNVKLLSIRLKTQEKSESAQGSANARWGPKKNANALRTQSERNAYQIQSIEPEPEARYLNGNGSGNWHPCKWEDFRKQYPKNVFDADARIYMSVIESAESESLLMSNLPLWKATTEWRGGFVPSASNFLSKLMWKQAPKIEARTSKVRQALDKAEKMEL
jgi:uncharacterized protein YdaU (DUF1376 family)